MEEAPSRRTALWPDEIAALKEASIGEMQVVIDCLVCSGLRIGEFLALKRSEIDVDGSKSQLIVRSLKRRGHPTRTVPLYPRGKAAYQIFKHDLRRYEQSWYQSRMREASSVAFENRTVTPHWLRHTYISWMLNDLGIPLQVVSPLAGHKSYKTTRKYAHATDESMARMLNRAVGIFDEASVSPVAEYLHPGRAEHGYSGPQFGTDYKLS